MTAELLPTNPWVIARSTSAGGAGEPEGQRDRACDAADGAAEPQLVQDRVVGTAPAVPAGCVLAHGWPPGPVFLERVPGSLARLGVWDGVSPRVDLHSPHFMVDERAVAAGIRLMAHTALAALQH